MYNSVSLALSLELLHCGITPPPLLKITNMSLFKKLELFKACYLVALSLLPISLSASKMDVSIMPDTLPSNCYAISDLGNPDVLFSYDTLTDMWTQVGSTGVNGIESMALNPVDQKLYAVDQSVFGEVDLMTGAFTPVGPALGQADGALGTLTIVDVDGLSYDPFLDVFQASVRRNGTGIHDLLIQIDPVSGTLVQDAFGLNIDYVVMEEVMDIVINQLVYDIDDVAVDITNGDLYAISNQGGNGGMLVIYDKMTGLVQTVVGSFNGIDDMEALGFFNDGSLFGATGNNGPDPADRNRYFTIDKTNGQTMSSIEIDTTGNQVDFEACDCVSGSANEITGIVDLGAACVCDNLTAWNDIVVRLYNDANGNGIVDAPADILIDTDTIDSGQMYSFLTGAVGDFIVNLDGTSLPIGYSIVGTDTYTPSFVGFNNVSNNNDFEFCATLEASLVNTTCDDNNTSNNGFDDFMAIELSADSDSPGASNTYEVYYQGVLLNPGGTTYGTSVVLGAAGEFSADASSTYTFSIIDSDTSACAMDLDVAALPSCSACLPICLPITFTKN